MKKIFKGMILGLSALIFSGGNLYAVELDKMGGVQIHGFISQGYLYSDENNFYADTENGTPKFNELGINFTSDVTDRLKMGVQLFRRSLGEFGGEVELDWGYASYLLKDWFGIRAGRMKLAHGLYNQVRDVDMTRTNIVLPQSIYNEAWRDSVNAIDGAGIYGDINLGTSGSITYEFQGGVVSVEPDGGVATTAKEQLQMPLVGIDFDAEESKATASGAGAITWNTPVDGFKMGVSGWHNDIELKGKGVNFPTPGGIDTLIAAGLITPNLDKTVDVDFDIISKQICAYFEYAINDLTLSAEYAYARYFFEMLYPGSTSRPLETEGYYVSAAYRFNEIYELAMYYSEYYADKDERDPSTTGTRWLQTSDASLKDICMSHRFDITRNWILKLEGHIMDGSALIMKGNNPTPREDDWYLLGAKMTFSF